MKLTIEAGREPMYTGPNPSQKNLAQGLAITTGGYTTTLWAHDPNRQWIPILAIDPPAVDQALPAIRAAAPEIRWAGRIGARDAAKRIAEKAALSAGLRKSQIARSPDEC